MELVKNLKSMLLLLVCASGVGFVYTKSVTFQNSSDKSMAICKIVEDSRFSWGRDALIEIIPAGQQRNVEIPNECIEPVQSPCMTLAAKALEKPRPGLTEHHTRYTSIKEFVPSGQYSAFNLSINRYNDVVVTPR